MFSRPGRNPAQTAARTALLAPLLAFVLGVVFSVSHDKKPGEYWETLGWALAGAFAVVSLSIAGVVAGILALKRMRQHGRQGVVVRASIGLGLNVLILGAIVAGFIGGIQARGRSAQLRQDSAAHAQEFHDLMAKAGPDQFAATQTATLLNKIARDQEAAAEYQVGAGRIGSLFTAEQLRQIQARGSGIARLFQRFNESGGIDPAGITQAADFDHRLELLAGWKQAVDELDLFLNGAPGRLRAELDRNRIAAPEAEDYVARFSQGLSLDLNNEIIQAQRDQIRAVQEYLLLLKQQWGHWKLNSNDHSIAFDDPALDGQIDRIGANMDNAQKRIDDVTQRMAQRTAARKSGR